MPERRFMHLVLLAISWETGAVPSSPHPLLKKIHHVAFAASSARLRQRRSAAAGGSRSWNLPARRPGPLAAATSSTSAKNAPKILSPSEADDAIAPLLNMASAHFASQALLAAVRLGVPDVIGNATLALDDIVSELSSSRGGFPNVNRDALLRSMRMLSSAGIFEESFATTGEVDDDDNGKKEQRQFAYSLTAAGALLQSRGDGDGDGAFIPDHQPSLGCGVEHWIEGPLWDAWAALPDYVAGTSSDAMIPFERANGVPVAEFYGQNPTSLRQQNDFVRFVASREEPAVLGGFDWSSLKGQTVVDVGGHHGAVLGAVVRSFPDIGRCLSLDLPEVVEMAPGGGSTQSPHPGVELVGGDMFDPSTIPPCDAILLRHMLCNFDDETATQILRNCHSVLPSHGKVIIGDIILPDAGEATGNDNGRTKIFVDSLMMLVGIRGERIKSEWAALASAAGFKVDSVVSTSSPSCDMMLLVKKQ